MPAYIYECNQESCGEKKEVFSSVENRKNWLKCPTCGKRMFRNIAAEQRGNPPGGSGYPYASDALAVHPDQVSECLDHDRKCGISAEYTRDGRPIITSRAMKAKYERSYGFFNKDGGYGDSQKRS